MLLRSAASDSKARYSSAWKAKSCTTLVTLVSPQSERLSESRPAPSEVSRPLVIRKPSEPAVNGMVPESLPSSDALPDRLEAAISGASEKLVMVAVLVKRPGAEGLRRKAPAPFCRPPNSTGAQSTCKRGGGKTEAQFERAERQRPVDTRDA